MTTSSDHDQPPTGPDATWLTLTELVNMLQITERHARRLVAEKKIPYTKPIRKIQGCNTLLNQPTDIKLNKVGIIYVADSTRSGSGIIYVFPAGSNGNVAPTNYTSRGAVTGLGIIP